MENKEAIKTALEDWLNTPLSADEIAFSRSDGKVTTQVSVAFYAGYKAAMTQIAHYVWMYSAKIGVDE